MKSLFRNALVNTFALFIISQLIGGLNVSGGFATFLFGGITLSLLFLTVKPILNLLSLPLNVITFGLFSTLANVLIFYLLTVVVPGLSINAFTFPGIRYAGFVVPFFSFNILFAFILVAFLQSMIVWFISWLFEVE